MKKRKYIDIFFEKYLNELQIEDDNYLKTYEGISILSKTLGLIPSASFIEENIKDNKFKSYIDYEFFIKNNEYLYTIYMFITKFIINFPVIDKTVNFSDNKYIEISKKEIADEYMQFLEEENIEHKLDYSNNFNSNMKKVFFDNNNLNSALSLFFIKGYLIMYNDKIVVGRNEYKKLLELYEKLLKIYSYYFIDNINNYFNKYFTDVKIKMLS
jgi:hypothetical protein